MTSANGDGELVGRVFLSEEVTEDGAPRELVEATRIRLEFKDDGQLSANAGCNHLFGTVTIGDETLEIDSVEGTEMGCEPPLHDQDTWLTEFLTASPAWALNGDRLTLTAGSTEMVLLDREVADPDRPLAGTTWVVDTIISGTGADGTASSMYAGTERSAWLEIDDETSTANTGCREVSGNVIVGGDAVRFTDAVQTDQACPPELVDVDEVMTTILGGEAVTFEIDAARLILTHPEDVGLGLQADE